MKNVAYSKEYNSWTEFLDELNKDPGFKGQSKDTDKYNWYKTKNFKEATNLLLNGWQKGTNDILKLKEKLDLNILLEKNFSIKFDLIGDYPDPAIYNSGNPECMVDFVYKNAKKGTINLHINSAASSSFSEEDFNRRGAATLCLIDNLETQGYRCALYTGETLYAGYDNQIYEVITPLKEPNQQIDLSRLAFVTSHPSFLRRIMFHINELSPPAIRDQFGFSIHGGYGVPTSFKNVLKSQIDLIIPELHTERTSPFHSDQNSEKWIKEQISFFQNKITQQTDYDEV